MARRARVAPPPVSRRPPGRPLRDRGRDDPRRADRRDLGAPAVPRAVAPVADLASPWGDALDLGPAARARRLPVGPRADPRRRCATTCSRRPTRSTTRSRRGATPELAGELGDLLLQVILHAQLAAEAGVFDMTDVWAAIASKIVRRHPHVFGDAEARTASDVNRQWERIKADERAEAAAGAGDGRRAGAQERPRRDQPLPARARREPGDAGARREPRLRLAVDRRRARQGPRGGRRARRGRERRRTGRGAGRPAVRPGQRRRARRGSRSRARCARANEKFRRRFRHVERPAAARDVALRDLSFEQLDALWDAAKAAEREEARS